MAEKYGKATCKECGKECHGITGAFLDHGLCQECFDRLKPEDPWDKVRQQADNGGEQ